MKPNWWAVGEGMWITSAGPGCRRSTNGASWRAGCWSGPLGSSVVPEARRYLAAPMDWSTASLGQQSTFSPADFW